MMAKKPDALEFYTEKELAEILRCSVSRLQKDRCQKKGIPYLKWGMSVLYSKAEVKKYVESQTVSPAMGAR